MEPDLPEEVFEIIENTANGLVQHRTAKMLLGW